MRYRITSLAGMRRAAARLAGFRDAQAASPSAVVPIAPGTRSAGAMNHHPNHGKNTESEAELAAPLAANSTEEMAGSTGFEPATSGLTVLALIRLHRPSSQRFALWRIRRR